MGIRNAVLKSNHPMQYHIPENKSIQSYKDELEVESLFTFSSNLN